MSRSIFASIALFASLSPAGSALADDLTPPPWRFNPGTTVQHWDFSSGPTGFAPDALPLNNIYGSPVMIPTGSATWLPTFAGRPAVWDITAGSLNFDVPNTGNTTHQKDLWLQVTFFGLTPVINPALVVSSSSGNFTQIGGPFNTILPGGWVHQLTQWNISVCPQLEHVTISPGFTGAPMLIDQVVIDTQCIPIPSPGAAPLLGFGGLLTLRRRRPHQA